VPTAVNAALRQLENFAEISPKSASAPPDISDPISEQNTLSLVIIYQSLTSASCARKISGILSRKALRKPVNCVTFLPHFLC